MREAFLYNIIKFGSSLDLLFSLVLKIIFFFFFSEEKITKSLLPFNRFNFYFLPKISLLIFDLKKKLKKNENFFLFS